MKNSHKFFSNKECKYYPCHKLDETEKLNCLFCFCPLYLMEKECGGNFVYLPNGVKDCSGCIKTHNGEEGYNYVIDRIKRYNRLEREMPC